MPTNLENALEKTRSLLDEPVALVFTEEELNNWITEGVIDISVKSLCHEQTDTITTENEVLEYSAPTECVFVHACIYVIDLFTYSDDNPETIDDGQEKTITVTGGYPPFTWSVTGTGFSFAEATTEGRTNTLIADGTECDDAEVTVTCANRYQGLQRIHPRLLAHIAVESDPGPPMFYYHHHDKIGFHPVPNGAYTVTVFFSKVTDDIDDLPSYLRNLTILYSVALARLSEGWEDDFEMFIKMYLNSLMAYREDVCRYRQLYVDAKDKFQIPQGKENVSRK